MTNQHSIVYVNGRRTVRPISQGERILTLARAGIAVSGIAPNGARVTVRGSH